MRKYRNIIYAVLILIVSLLVFTLCFYNFMLLPVSSEKALRTITITNGMSNREIAKTLYDNKLIKNKDIFILYLKINRINSLKASKYDLSSNMGVKKIIEVLSLGNSYNEKQIKITFKEGINMRHLVKLISEQTNNSEEDLYTLLQDDEYIATLIKEYWFLTDAIKNKDIYYPLEGYLFPETYAFLNKDVMVKDIIKKMLDEFNKRVTPYKSQIESSSLSIHEIITLASLVELEGANADDRTGVAGVFYNRLKDNWSLGSDVTTYYAIKVDMSERDLYAKELNDCSNGYNTRCTSLIGLPVGPIANPSLNSIIATLNPTSHDYYYFVADKNKKTYFAKTGKEHQKIISTLKENDLWYTY